MTANHVTLGRAKILYIALKCAGWPQEKILAALPHDNGKVGYSPNIIYEWRNDPDFAEMERLATADPLWFHTTIVNPMKLAALDGHDLLHVLEVGDRKFDEYKKLGGKVRELLITELKLIGGAEDPTAKLRELFANIRFEFPVAPDKVLDVTPVPQLVDEAAS